MSTGNVMLAWRTAAVSAVLVAASVCGVRAADIADVPLGTMTDGTAVRSNLMFILDNSGSMGWNYLPDNAPTNNVCFGSKDRNVIFYDPAKTYLPPLNADGTSMSNATFNAAWRDGFNTSAGTVNLTNNNPETPPLAATQLSSTATTQDQGVCGARNSPSCNPADSTSTSTNGDGNVETTMISYSLIDNGSTNCRNNRNNSCRLIKQTTVTVSTPGGRFLWAERRASASASSCNQADFNIVQYSASLPPAQLQNYANWFSYYRTRMLSMRAGAGRAFAQIDASRFRVGFSTISTNSVADGPQFLNIRDYDGGTQKTGFFQRLYGTAPDGWTPLRPALEKAGRYFANKASGQATDPVQFSCQRNYTILSTDGYWNTNGEPSGYSPRRLNGTSIGNPDGAGVSPAVPRPLRDSCSPSSSSFGGTYCSGTAGAGFSNSLADIAMYFYETDLRTPALGNCTGSVSGQDVCENNVPGDGRKDAAEHQHMTTFTLGLGVNGTLEYNKNYETQTTGDFWDIRQGTKVWPNPMQAEGPARIDDLWHAAVNGRGFYYSAGDAQDLASSLVDALKKIDARTGSASAAATSSLTPSAGDDWLFLPLYETKTWVGTVNAYKINTATGQKLSDEPVWSAADRVKAQAERNILFRAVGGLAPFTYANLLAAGKAASFDNLCTSGAEKLSQCASLSAAAKAKVTGPNMIDFLRGKSTYEVTAAAEDDQLFRERKGPLGDIVNGAPVYVKRPPFNYADAGYAAFVSAQAGRQAMLYVAANDGMLHALKVSDDDTGGTELWAYVPSMVMPNMPALADTDYESKHRFFVDGAPVVADVKDADGNWRTILVGGLGKGGRGYFALDITDPTSPKSLWEFTDNDLGLTFGNPIITKNKAGTWIVAFSSGYNNVGPGSGRGHLYVLNAVTGAPLKKIATSAGSTGAPSNLGKINAWVDDDKDNVASRIYGADMLGNVWRFDFDDNLPGDDAFLVARTGASQPITTKPMLSEVAVGPLKYVVVSVATGRYLGVTDIGDSAVQSVYSFKDDLSTTPLGLLRSNDKMVKQTLKADRSELDNPSPVDWSKQAGWYVDLSLSSGERVNVDFEQQLNMLIVASNIPTPTVCSPGGTSWLYYFDVGSGKLLQQAYSSDSLVAGITSIVSSTGKLITLVQGVDGKNTPRLAPELNPGATGELRRASWRELAN